VAVGGLHVQDGDLGLGPRAVRNDLGRKLRRCCRPERPREMAPDVRLRAGRLVGDLSRRAPIAGGRNLLSRRLVFHKKPQDTMGGAGAGFASKARSIEMVDAGLFKGFSGLLW